jgi:hypothetical protein
VPYDLGFGKIVLGSLTCVRTSLGFSVGFSVLAFFLSSFAFSMIPFFFSFQDLSFSLAFLVFLLSAGFFALSTFFSTERLQTLRSFFTGFIGKTTSLLMYALIRSTFRARLSSE